jgi:hypothetical protein
MPAIHDVLDVPPRFCGPPGTANGGFACGAIARLLGEPAEVTLRRPVPLGRSLTVRSADDGSLTVLDGTTTVAEARPAPLPAEPTPPEVSADVARAVAGRAAYYAAPAFPGCFVCGPDRAAGDGLRIFPGPVSDRSVWAAPWIPDRSVADDDGRVRPEVVWAALDCPAGIAAGEAAELPDDVTCLLGRMSARVIERPEVGRPCRVVAWPLGRDGRKLAAGSALLDAAGSVLATSRSLWLTVPSPAARRAVGAAS